MFSVVSTDVAYDMLLDGTTKIDDEYRNERVSPLPDKEQLPFPENDGSLGDLGATTLKAGTRRTNFEFQCANPTSAAEDGGPRCE